MIRMDIRNIPLITTFSSSIDVILELAGDKKISNSFHLNKHQKILSFKNEKKIGQGDTPTKPFFNRENHFKKFIEKKKTKF